MRNVFVVLSSSLLVAACGGNSTPANEPAAPSASGAPMTSATAEPTPNAPSMPEGKCGATTTSSATALDACLAECEKLDDKAPEGTRCLPPRTSCKLACDSKFKK